MWLQGFGNYISPFSLHFNIMSCTDDRHCPATPHTATTMQRDWERERGCWRSSPPRLYHDILSPTKLRSEAPMPWCLEIQGNLSWQPCRKRKKRGKRHVFVMLQLDNGKNKNKIILRSCPELTQMSCHDICSCDINKHWERNEQGLFLWKLTNCLKHTIKIDVRLPCMNIMEIEEQLECYILD